jgi:hypothetical protein
MKALLTALCIVVLITVAGIGVKILFFPGPRG